MNARVKPGHDGEEERSTSCCAAPGTRMNRAPVSDGRQELHGMAPGAILLMLRSEGEAREPALRRRHLAHQPGRRLVHAVIDHGGALGGEVRALDVVDQGALTLLDALGDLAADHL